MYIDAYFEKDKDTVHVVERKNGKRSFIQYPATYQFFIQHPRGTYRSIYDEPLMQIRSKTYKDFQKNIKIYNDKKLYESDLNQTFVCLSEHYMHAEPPVLNVCFFDIEVGFDPKRGYSSTTDAFMPITAVSLYLQWLDTLVTLAVPPKTISFEQAEELTKDLPNTFICRSEKELLLKFLDYIQEADILSGWNSTGYDIPYTINRIKQVLSKDDTRRMCLWNLLPKPRDYEKFGKISSTYDLVGRVHLDYLDLYQKYTYEEQPSYRLDFIGQIEVNESKTVYEGTLDQLYNKDFRTFIIYNRQDVALLNKLDVKLRFINTANALAHANTVLLQTTLGAVAVTEQAIINEAHELGLRVANRRKIPESESTQAAGAYVAYPRKGLHKWIGSLDINSLYPSTIRALNMGPETIVGQVRQELTDAYIKDKMSDKFVNGKKVKGSSFAAAWEGIFAALEYDLIMNQDKGTILKIDWIDGKTTSHSAAEIYDIIFNKKANKLMMSANGTIFSHEREGVIPGLLKKWYAERKQFQAINKNYLKLEGGIPVPENFAIINYDEPSSGSVKDINWEKFDKIFQNGDVAGFKSLLLQYDLIVKDKKVYGRDQLAVSGLVEYWDKAQHIKKINLNSLYGAILNSGCRFFDKRIGQSTTLTGRQIVKHMTAEVNQIIDGTYDYLGKSIIYNDTDSVYFSAYESFKNEINNGSLPWNKEVVVELYDKIGEMVNETFPDFMLKAFNCPKTRGNVIKAGREIVGTNSLFITKKRYAVLYYDKEGKRKDKDGKEGEIKAMGLDLKRSDTPEYMQDFLSEILENVLTDVDHDVILDKIRDFRDDFKQRPGWEKGTPKRVNNIGKFLKIEDDKGKANMPGHVRAAINWNILKKLNNDQYSMNIVDGFKVIVCKLKANPLGFTSIAYPIDELRLPEWFKELPFDDSLMEDIIIDNKLENLIGVLDFDINSTSKKNIFDSLFTYND